MPVSQNDAGAGRVPVSQNDAGAGRGPGRSTGSVAGGGSSRNGSADPASSVEKLLDSNKNGPAGDAAASNIDRHQQNSGSKGPIHFSPQSAPSPSPESSSGCSLAEGGPSLPKAPGDGLGGLFGKPHFGLYPLRPPPSQSAIYRVGAQHTPAEEQVRSPGSWAPLPLDNKTPIVSGDAAVSGAVGGDIAGVISQPTDGEPAPGVPFPPGRLPGVPHPPGRLPGVPQPPGRHPRAVFFVPAMGPLLQLRADMDVPDPSPDSWLDPSPDPWLDHAVVDLADGAVDMADQADLPIPPADGGECRPGCCVVVVGCGEWLCGCGWLW